MSGVFRLGVEVESHLVYSEGRTHTVVDGVTVDGRSVVLIDPDSREQVERLLVNFKWPKPVPSYVVKEMQAALREVANPTPPKPEEPTGLGAVVEDAARCRWVKIDTHSRCNDWTPLGADSRTIDGEQTVRWRYDEIAAVRVLSEGVTE